MNPCWNRAGQCMTKRDLNASTKQFPRSKRYRLVSSHVKHDAAELDRAPLVDSVRHLEHDHQEQWNNRRLKRWARSVGGAKCPIKVTRKTRDLCQVACLSRGAGQTFTAVSDERWRST